jgi:hypothetical protein
MKRLIFTIIFNGRHHLEHNNYAEMLAQNCDAWVFIEGAANPGGSTQWCKPILSQYHNNWHSVDGTVEYIQELAQRHKNITLIQRDGAWESKDVQVNAGITFLKKDNNEGFLWEVDVDEQWDPNDMAQAEKELIEKGIKTGGFLCNCFVGKNLRALGEWGEGKISSYRRLWNWKGELFSTHEPPCLKGNNDPFYIFNNIRFNHYSYFFEQDVKFKNDYYSGHEGIYNNWLNLQKETSFPQPLSKLISGGWGQTKTIIEQIK